MTGYWVVGGAYTDTGFGRIAGGGDEQRFGPYESHEKARDKWAALSRASEDNALVRYRIEHDGVKEHWVVGGKYTETDFRTTVDGRPEERIGPFRSYEEALDVWRAKAWATVDDGYVRFRIEQA